MDDAEVWAAVDRRRRAIVACLDDLRPAEWDVPSLCAGWSVRDVAAHLTMAGLSMPQLLLLAARHPGGTNHVIREGSRDLARRHDTDELVRRVTGLIGLHRAFPGMTCRESLIDAIGHSLDIAVPLEREVDIPVDDLMEAADRVASYEGRGKAKVFRPLPLQRFRLTATDCEWSRGDGEEVTGAIEDLFLLLTGRTVGISRLGGDGADRLRGVIAELPGG